MKLFHMVYYIADKLIRHVAILGGTHGNERLGVTLAQLWTQHPSAVQRSTFKTTVLLANAEAARLNVRYVDTDLNRCFTTETLSAQGSKLEEKLAAELVHSLGPKREDGCNCACDFVLDLHSTTSNMGLSLIMCADGDPFSRRVAQHLQRDFEGLKVGLISWAPIGTHSNGHTHLFIYIYLRFTDTSSSFHHFLYFTT